MNIDIIRILTISDYDLIELLLLTYIVLSIMCSIMIYFFNVQVFPKNMLLLKSKSFVTMIIYFHMIALAMSVSAYSNTEELMCDER